MRILLLGGTTEASQLAERLATEGIVTVFSYAGRTLQPRLQPLPTRIGGFGGPVGLAAFLKTEAITHVVDATHPFARTMSLNAIAASDAAGVPLIALERAGWQEGPGDNWHRVADVPTAAAALPQHPARIFLAIGRQQLAAFDDLPHHFYLLRMVDPPERLPFADCAVLPLEGPMTMEAEAERLRTHGITHVVAKNAGGLKSRAKLDAARQLALPVLLVDRPQMPPRKKAESVEAVMRWLAHGADRGV